jgi:spore germination protein
MMKVLNKSPRVGVLVRVWMLSVILMLGFLVSCQSRPNQDDIKALITDPVYLPVIIKPASSTLTLGYYTGDQRSYNAIQSFASYLRIVSSDVYAVQLNGSIVGSDGFGAVAFDQAHGIQTYACLNNWNNDPGVDSFDASLAHAAIVTHKAAVISSLLSIAQNGGYAGVNIDLENLVYSSDINQVRSDFTAFIHDLSLQLHAHGVKLAVSVPGKTQDSVYDTWSYPYDLAALGADADYLQLMTYDEHGDWSGPGPVAGADWVEDCVAFAASLVDPSKLLVGLPAYGYDWDLTASNPGQGNYSVSGFSWIDVPALLARPGAVQHWDVASQSPWVTYTRSGHSHEAWYENPASIQAKTALVSQYNLAGLSMWSLGQEDLTFWQAAVSGLP